MATFRQASFAGGEVSPSLHGRSDFERYNISLRRAKNFLVTPEGKVQNRPGTKYINAVKDSTKRTRLVPFRFTDDENYILEFGHLYIRFYKNGVRLGAPYEVVTTYTEAQLPYLKFAQLGDILTITHGDHVPRELTRVADTTWTLTAFAFAPYEAWMAEEPGIDWTTFPTPDADHPAREWRWQITHLLQDSATGEYTESLPTDVVDTIDVSAGPVYPRTNNGYITGYESMVALSPDTPVRIGWQDNPFVTPVPPVSWGNSRSVARLIYRGRGGVYGYIGQTTSEIFVDVGEDPNYAQQPPTGRNPFEVRAYDETLLRTEHPSCIGFFGQRLAFARTDERPAWFWLSRIGDYVNFDKNTVVVLEDASVEYALGGNAREEIRSILGLDALYFFTTAGVWVGSEFEAKMKPNLRKHSDAGASWLSPLVVSDSPLYVTRVGRRVLEVSYANERGKFDTADLTVFARHLFEDDGIVDWAFAEEPHGIVWAVREDGVLLSMVYDRRNQVLAWSWHETDGVIENVCASPEGNESAVYLVVRRTLNGSDVRCIERMESRKVADDWAGAVDEPLFLDCAVTWTGTGNTVTGLSHLNGEEVYAVADGRVLGPFTVSGGSINLGLADGATFAQVGLAYESDFEPLDVVAAKQEIRGRRKTVTKVVLEVEKSRGASAGETYDDLEEWRQHTVAAGYNPDELFTGDVEIPLGGSWNEHGRIVVRQSLPLPLTILALRREVDVGGE